MTDFEKKRRVQIGINIDFSVVNNIRSTVNLMEIIWYYNNIPEKRYEIEKYYFRNFKTFEDWYLVYKKSPASSFSKRYAFKKMPQLLTDLDKILEIYQIDFDDEDLRKMAWEKLTQTLPDRFDIWKKVFDKTYYEKEIHRFAFKKMLLLAKTKDEWFDFYERCEPNTKAQLVAIEHLYGKLDRKDTYNMLKYEDKFKAKDIREYKKRYEEFPFFSKTQKKALTDMYLAADTKVKNTHNDKND